MSSVTPALSALDSPEPLFYSGGANAYMCYGTVHDTRQTDYTSAWLGLAKAKTWEKCALNAIIVWHTNAILQHVTIYKARWLEAEDAKHGDGQDDQQPTASQDVVLSCLAGVFGIVQGGST
jgi:hypothetical protein